MRRILSFKGVLFLKHLLRGVKLGLFDDAAAMVKFQDWHLQHEADINRRTTAHKKAQKDRRNQPFVRKVEAAPAVEAVAETPEADTEVGGEG